MLWERGKIPLSAKSARNSPDSPLIPQKSQMHTRISGTSGMSKRSMSFSQTETFLQAGLRPLKQLIVERLQRSDIFVSSAQGGPADKNVSFMKKRSNKSARKPMR